MTTDLCEKNSLSPSVPSASPVLGLAARTTPTCAVPARCSNAFTLNMYYYALGEHDHEGYRPALRVNREKKKNFTTGRLLRLPDRLVPITMHHWTELIELDPIELQTKSISECGPAKRPSEDEKNASWRHRKAPRCARRGRPAVVRPGPRGSNMVSKCVYVIYEAP